MVPKIDDRIFEKFKPSSFPQSSHIVESKPEFEFLPGALASNPSIKKTSGIEDRADTNSKEPVKPVV